MKPETLLYDKVRYIIPENSDKTVFFGAISNTSFEMFFYSFIDGTPVQCYSLAEEGILEENELSEVFEGIVNIIKESKLFDDQKNNIVTINIDKSGIKLEMEYADKNAGMYSIKKEWKKKNIS